MNIQINFSKESNHRIVDKKNYTAFSLKAFRSETSFKQPCSGGLSTCQRREEMWAANFLSVRQRIKLNYTFIFIGTHQISRFWSLYWSQESTQNRILQRNFTK